MGRPWLASMTLQGMETWYVHNGNMLTFALVPPNPGSQLESLWTHPCLQQDLESSDEVPSGTQKCGTLTRLVKQLQLGQKELRWPTNMRSVPMLSPCFLNNLTDQLAPRRWRPPASDISCSILEILRKERGAAPDRAGYRPTPEVYLGAPQEQEATRALMARQNVPRLIVQTGPSFAKALRTHGSLMQTWWNLNPEYEYRFMDDDACDAFVRRVGSPDEIRAWRSIVLGAMRADLFRLLWLKYRGGVYADIDMELGRPLREIIPAHASAVVSLHWSFELLIYTPHHPIIEETARIATDNILEQVRMLRDRDEKRCFGTRKCVIEVSGPQAYLLGVHRVSQRGDCAPAHQRNNPHPRAPIGRQDCLHSPLMRNVRMCGVPFMRIGHVEGGLSIKTTPPPHGPLREPAWECAAARHWDCRRTMSGDNCTSTHWSRADQEQQHNIHLRRTGRIHRGGGQQSRGSFEYFRVG